MTAQDYLTIGKNLTICKATMLGFGGMRMPDAAVTAKMVDAYLNSGYNFFDTAWIYGGSEEMFKEVLVKRHPRDKFLMANKLPPWEITNAPEDCEKLFKEQLRRTGLDYFDFYLVHSIDDGREQDVEDKGLFQWVAEQKKKGFVRHMGFSFHGSAECLDRVLDRHPEAEFVYLQLNYKDILYGPVGGWHEVALKYGIPIFAMEPVKGGSLAALPAPAEKLLKEHDPSRSVASWAIQYAATLEGVTCVLSGMSGMEQLQDNLKTFKELKPLAPHEIDLLKDVLDEMAKVSNISCTACKYCHAACPAGINIAECFSLYNDVKRGAAGWNRTMMYRALPQGKRAADCTGCDACLSHCPQKVDIPRELKVVAQTLR